MLFSIYQNVVMLLAIFLMGMLTGAWLLSAYMRWSEQLARLGCDDPTEPVSYVGQDRESTHGIHSNTCTTSYGPIVVDGRQYTYDPDAWKHASVKVPHAE